MRKVSQQVVWAERKLSPSPFLPLSLSLGQLEPRLAPTRRSSLISLSNWPPVARLIKLSNNRKLALCSFPLRSHSSAGFLVAISRLWTHSSIAPTKSVTTRSPWRGKSLQNTRAMQTISRKCRLASRGNQLAGPDASWTRLGSCMNRLCMLSEIFAPSISRSLLAKLSSRLIHQQLNRDPSIPLVHLVHRNHFGPRPVGKARQWQAQPRWHQLHSKHESGPIALV